MIGPDLGQEKVNVLAVDWQSGKRHVAGNKDKRKTAAG